MNPRRALRAALALSAALLARPAAASLPAFTTGQAANFVLGQNAMTASAANQGGSAGAATLNVPLLGSSDGTRLFVADTSNNRVLIYPSTPTVNGSSATIAVGQTDLLGTSVGLTSASTLNGPGAAFSDGTRLFVADFGNNRVLIFNTIPSASGAAANVVVGQPDMSSNSPNQASSSPGSQTLNGPTGVWSDGTRLFIADRGNNRVLVYNSIPTSNDAAASFALGQPNMSSKLADQGGSPTAVTMSSPTAVWSDGTRLYVADYLNNRALIFNTIPISTDAAASVAVGQPDLVSSGTVSASAASLKAPFGVYSDGVGLYVADFGNNRVLVYGSIPAASGAAASVALGQNDLVSSAANQGAAAPSSATISGPAAVFADGGRLYVADEGNNRVLQFGIPAPTGLAAAALGASSVAWTWNAAAGATGYEFYPSTGGAPIATAATSLTLVGLSPNAPYGARLSAVTSAGQGALTATVTGYTLPVAPTGLSVVSVGSTTVTLSWTDGVNPAGTSYVVEVTSDPAFAAGIATQTLTALTTAFSGLAAATTYYAQVAALGGAGVAVFDPAVVSTATELSSAPTGLTGAGRSPSSILWSWTAALGATSYNVFEATSPTTSLGTSATTSFLETGLSTNAAYGVVVQAVGPLGAGALSPAATAYTQAAAPQNLAASAVYFSSASLSWTAGGNPAGTAFLVAVSSVAGFGAPTTTQTLTGVTTTFLGLVPGVFYGAQVYARSGDGVLTAGPASITFETGALVPAGLSLTGVAVSSRAVLWSWSAAGGFSAPASFSLWTSTSGLLATLSGSATAFVQAGLAAGTTAAAYLQATNPAGSAFSSTASVQTPALVNFAAGTASSGTIVDPVTGQPGLGIPAGALATPGGWAMTDDPLGAPLVSSMPALIAQANAALAGTAGAASSAREYVALVGGLRYTGTFGSPVTVTVPYPDANGDGIVDGTRVLASTLQLYTLDEATGRWTAVPGSSVDAVRRLVSAPVSHLSVFTALGPASPAASDLSGVRVYPDPWRPGSGGNHDAAAMTFDGLTSAATIRIFTMSGRLVKRLDKPDSVGSATVLWDGTDDSGRTVADGVYYWAITSPAGRKTGRLAVLR